MANINEMRYGISALGLSHKEYAENDELLVEQSSGKMFYKRESDNQIVSFDNEKYSQETLPVAMNTAIELAKTYIKTNVNNFVTYHTIDISEKTDLLDDSEVNLSIGTKFNVSKDEGAFYIRIHGDTLTNTIMSYLEKSYPTCNESMEIVFSIEETSTGTVQEVVVYTKYNLLTLVKIPEVVDAVSYEVSVVSVRSMIAKSSYTAQSESIKNLLVALNNGNTKFESTTIDIVSYVSDISSSTIYNTDDNVKLELMLPSTLIDTISISSKSEGIVVSEEKPDRKCVWGKILTSN